MADGTSLRLLIDMDGVLYRGGKLLPGVQDFFDWLRDPRRAWALVTNNSTRSPTETAQALQRMGIEVNPHRIVSSATATAAWLRRKAPDGARVLVLGGPGLFEAVFTPPSTFIPDWATPEWVVVGLDFDVTYRKLSDACLAVQRGARFVGTNPDTSFPTPDGLTPGAGSLQAVVTSVTGVQPVIIGKPEPALYEMALQSMPDSGQVVVLGDRLDTDILAGQRIGATTILLLTGVSTREEAEHGDIHPDYIYTDLPEFLSAWKDGLPT